MNETKIAGRYAKALFDLTLELDLVEKVKAAQSCKGPVMLTYTEEWMVAPWRADSKYFIQDVKCEQ